MNCSTLDSLADKILSNLPPGLLALSEEVRDILRDGLKDQLAKLDLVPKEEFDVQCAVLLRTQAKLAELEQTLLNVETKIREQTAAL